MDDQSLGTVQRAAVMIDSSYADRPTAEHELEQLAATLGVEASAWGALLLAHCAKSHIPLALKESASGRYAWVNEAMSQLVGVPIGEMVGRSDAELPAAAAWPSMRAAEQAAALQPLGVVSEHRLEIGGRRREFSVLRLPVRNASRTATSGAAPYVAALWTELTETRQHEAQLARAFEQLEQQQKHNEQLRREGQETSLRDAATGLYIGAHFDDLLRREIDLSSREHREFTLVIVALDPPSATTGRTAEAQSRVLDALGLQLRGKTRAMDASCRLSEDRFAVLLSGVGLATSHARMEGLRRQCAAQIVVLDGRDLGFTVSMGVASFPHTADTQDGLIAAASEALTEAIRRGGNQVALASIRFDPV